MLKIYFEINNVIEIITNTHSKIFPHSIIVLAAVQLVHFILLNTYFLKKINKNTQINLEVFSALIGN